MKFWADRQQDEAYQELLNVHHSNIKTSVFLYIITHHMAFEIMRLFPDLH